MRESASTSKLKSAFHASLLEDLAQEELALSALLRARHEDAARIDLVLVHRAHRRHRRIVLLVVHEAEAFNMAFVIS